MLVARPFGLAGRRKVPVLWVLTPVDRYRSAPPAGGERWESAGAEAAGDSHFSLQIRFFFSATSVSWLYFDRILLYCHDTEKYG